MKKYYKIGEISKIYNIGRDSLRYYEEMGILSPKRGENGYRIYSLQDLWKLNLIRELRILDFPMEKIKIYLDNRSIDTTLDFLKEEIEILDERIRELENIKLDIGKRIENISKNLNIKEFEIPEIVYIDERKAVLLEEDISKDEEVDFLIKKLHKKYEGKFNILGSNDIGAILMMEKVKESIYNCYEGVFCFVSPNEEVYDISFSSGEYMVLKYKGSYKKSGKLIPYMFDEIEKMNYEVIGKPIEIYRIDIHETSVVDEFITEIQIAIKKRD